MTSYMLFGIYGRLKAILYDSTQCCMAVESSCCEVYGSIQLSFKLTNETSVNKLTMLLK
jgi:hypothetical protein